MLLRHNRVIMFFQQTQAEFYQKILQQHRPEPEYFRVGFFGQGFPLFIRVGSSFFSIQFNLMQQNDSYSYAHGNIMNIENEVAWQLLTSQPFPQSQPHKMHIILCILLLLWIYFRTRNLFTVEMNMRSWCPFNSVFSLSLQEQRYLAVFVLRVTQSNWVTDSVSFVNDASTFCLATFSFLRGFTADKYQNLFKWVP